MVGTLKTVLCWKSLRMWLWFQTTPNTRICHFPRWPSTFFALLAGAPIIVLDVDFMGLWLQLHSLFLLPFCGSLLALSSLLVSQFCNFDVATMRPLAPLQQQMINLRKHTQLFVTGYFNCIRKWDGCLHTSNTFSCNPKEGRKLGPHPTNQEHALQD